MRHATWSSPFRFSEAGFETGNILEAAAAFPEESGEPMVREGPEPIATGVAPAVQEFSEIAGCGCKPGWRIQ